MHMGHHSDDVAEPACVYLSYAKRQETSPQPDGFRLVSALRIFSPTTYPSEILEAVGHAGAVQFLKGEDHLMEIGFEGERNGRVHDFRPGLPLRVCW